MPTDARNRPSPGDLPAEFFLDGPIPGGEELLLRTVARMRRQATRSARLRGVLLVAVIVLSGAVLTSAGMALGRLSDDDRVPVGGPIIASVDGARLTATMASGDGGSYFTVSVTGVPIGTTCRLTVIGQDGTRSDNGSWAIGPAPRPIETMTWMHPNQIAELDVVTSTGLELIAATK
ncbi:MAG TPA: hypothetical protein VFX16_25285 [Pseudonocardiaceae bacterium]|nr:hypothetical protein [Pseudonocardiaceae bacterium]